MKNVILITAGTGEILAKARVSAHTRKDGTYVAAYENSRQAAAQKPATGKKVLVAKPSAAGGDIRTWQDAQEHAVKSGAKYRSSVSVFSTADAAHSAADRARGSKGGAFVMVHPAHKFHVVVKGADSQRMERNGYQLVKPRQSDA